MSIQTQKVLLCKAAFSVLKNNWLTTRLWFACHENFLHESCDGEQKIILS